MAEILPPQSLEAEESVLGGLMIDPESIYRVMDLIGIEDFYRPAHRLIYQAMREVLDQKEPIDILTVTNRLRAKEQLEQVGGTAYLISLINKTPSSSHVGSHARIIRQKRIRRDLIHTGGLIQGLAHDETRDAETLLDEVESNIFKIAEQSSPYQFAHIGQFLEGAFQRIEELHRGDVQRLRGVPTGFPLLDQYLAGLQKSDLILFAARPSLGKTTFALDVARHVAVRHSTPVGIFSFEMSRDQIIDRLISGEANVSLWRLRTGKLYFDGDFNELSFLSEAFDRLSRSPIYIDDTPSLTVLQMRAMARRLQAEKGLSLLIIDYLQLIRGHRHFENRVQEIAEISRGLKSLARELNIPVVAISQLSRAPEHRTSQVPKLSDLRDSGTLEQDSDVVLFIHRPDMATPEAGRRNQAEIIIAKHRNGPLGSVTLYFDPESVSFHALATHMEEVELSG